MTLLQIMSETGEIISRSGDARRVAARLRTHGIRLEQWTADRTLADDANTDDVLTAYRVDIDRLRQEGNYRLVDVVWMRPDLADPQWPEKVTTARQKFLDEHTHDEDEVRFFVDGLGCFYLHLDDQVFAVVCEAGDLLSVPKGTRHWFDMGTAPRFCAIRFFQSEDGWVGNFTGDPVARRIPYLDALLAGLTGKERH